jgi:hypothetical protein
VHRPATVEQVPEVTATFMQHYNTERPHQGRACHNVPPRVAFPTLPILPSIPKQVDPDRWLETLQGRAFARTVRSDGSVTVDDMRYHVERELAGQVINLIVHAPDKAFDLFQGANQIKRLPIKGLSGKVVPFEEYVSLMRQEAHSDGHRSHLRYLGLHQASLWA